MLYYLHCLVINDPSNERDKFEVTDENRQTLTDLKHYLARVPGKLDYRKGIIFSGSVGTGKTMILEMLKSCITDLWGKQLEIFTAPYIKQQFYVDNDGHVNMSWKAQNYPYLGINDIGLELATGSGDEIIRTVLYERFEKRFYTFGTTNLSFDQMYKRYEYHDEVGRMADRFKHLSNYVNLTGESFR